jgi:hypothetical protein
LATVETEQIVLWRFIRGTKNEDGTYQPVFLAGAEGPLVAIESAEKRLAEIEKDSIEFSNLMGEFKSIRELAQAAHRENMKIQSAETSCRKILEREMSANHNLDPAEVLQMQSVRDTYLARDRIIAESKFEEFKSKMAACNRILEKY